MKAIQENEALRRRRSWGSETNADHGYRGNPESPTAQCHWNPNGQYLPNISLLGPQPLGSPAWHTSYPVVYSTSIYKLLGRLRSPLLATTLALPHIARRPAKFSHQLARSARQAELVRPPRTHAPANVELYRDPFHRFEHHLS
jgi:hypothetical protein